jgi:hypothetical protein
MRAFDWFFGKRKQSTGTSKTKYQHVTGNIEFATRVNRGEPSHVVIEDVNRKWTPGNEYLWDEYHIESLIDSDEKRLQTVNQLLYARVALYRALRSRGRDIKGLDPFRYALEVPDVAQTLSAKFPVSLAGGRLFQAMDVRSKKWSKTGRDAAADPAVLEGVVREAIADHFQLNPAMIDLSLSLSSQPVNAIGLDVLEVGMDIMERLEIPIPEDKWNQFLDVETGTEPIQLTPAGLIRLFQEVGR